MYTIGQISKAVQISVDALRHYDEIGLYKPHYVDTISRYRYYSDEQVKDLLAISEWRQYGFGLEMIKRLLLNQEKEKLQPLYQDQLDDLYAQRKAINQSIQLLEEQLKRLEDVKMTACNKTVLIIDDSAFMRMMLRDILEKEGFNVVGDAADGETGVTMYEQLRPDIVIVDIKMPGIHGIEAAKRIMQVDPNADIVMCSAHAQIMTILQCIQAGVRGFVAKPFMASSFIAEILNQDRELNAATVERIMADARARNFNMRLSQNQIDILFVACTEKGTIVDEELLALWSATEQLDEGKEEEFVVS
ncbi:response regulator [Paenibacillus sp. OV219]|uniref:response regulator n=1 Tax=Paenibacillus sp. OV219 TaxID=1884377 RepID=UPI0008CE92C5|nr:DNA-binding response regulator, NarL/FixJ family, contains REC and HTH domains [Paenibacillus sp. OV219]